KLAADLSLEMRRQGTCIARLQLVEPLVSIPPQRLVTGYSLGEQQSLDPIDVLDPLVCQRLAFTAKSAAVFLLWSRRPDPGADTPCFDIFSPPPGESDVINQVERLSSNETKIAPRLVRIAVGSSKWSSSDIGRLQVEWICAFSLRARASRYPLPMGSSIRSAI